MRTTRPTPGARSARAGASPPVGGDGRMSPSTKATGTAT